MTSTGHGKGKDQNQRGNCTCGTPLEPLLTPLIQQGKIVRPLPSPQQIRTFVLQQLERVTLI
jgi:hypothetical protein